MSEQSSDLEEDGMLNGEAPQDSQEKNLEDEVQRFKTDPPPLAPHTSAIDTLIAAANSDSLTDTAMTLSNGFDNAPTDSQLEVPETSVSLEQTPTVSNRQPGLGSPIQLSFPPASELDFLNPPTVATWVDTWFREYHTWLPILRKDLILPRLSNVQDPDNTPNDLIVKAIVAVTISHARQVICLGYAGRKALALRLRQEVVMHSISDRSLESLQALLIILVLDYGYARMTEFWSLMSVAKGIVLQLELSQTTERASDRSLAGSEDAALAIWSCRGLAAAANIGPCWVDSMESRISPPEEAIVFATGHPLHHIIKNGEVDAEDPPPSYADFVKLLIYGLSPIRIPVDRALALIDDRLRTQSERASCETTFLHVVQLTADCAPLTSPLESYKTNWEGHVFFDPNVVLTRIAFQAATINYVGKFCWPLNTTTDPWEPAITRCLSSTKYIGQVIREITDWDIEFISPLFIQYIFIAARFFIVYSQRTSNQKTVDFDLLMHAINMCGRRWPLARRLDLVLRTAIIEEGSGESTLPSDFFNLRIPALNVQDVLQKWVDTRVFPYRPTGFNLAEMSGPILS
ncbi:MAG: hypothetical protein Q9227_003863 [Pyrenula ochraceoflavens]